MRPFHSIYEARKWAIANVTHAQCGVDVCVQEHQEWPVLWVHLSFWVSVSRNEPMMVDLGRSSPLDLWGHHIIHRRGWRAQHTRWRKVMMEEFEIDPDVTVDSWMAKSKYDKRREA